MNTLPGSSFPRFGAICAYLSGAAGFLYAVAFIVVSRSAPDLGGLLSAKMLLLLGLFSSAAFIGLYGMLRQVDAPLAMWALVLQLAGALGAALHGGYDLANAINPPIAAAVTLPSAADPRGLLTFGFGGIGMLAASWIMAKGAAFPFGFRYTGFVSGGLLVVLYLGRLTVP
ncbi:MAG: hypothetical protein AAB289_12515 [Chloroflexota bacterium]